VQIPDKSCFELVKYYYMWKKIVSKADDTDAAPQQASVDEIRCVFPIFC